MHSGCRCRNGESRLILGLENLPVTLHEVLAGKARVRDAIYDGPFGVKVVPCGLSLQGFQQSNPPDRLKDIMTDLVSEFEILILDAPAGISRDGVIPLTIADGVILVVNPEISSIVDSLKTKILTETVGGHVEGGAIINGSRPPGTISTAHRWRNSSGSGCSGSYLKTRTSGAHLPGGRRSW